MAEAVKSDGAQSGRVMTPKRWALAGLIAALAITAALILNPRLVSPLGSFGEPVRNGLTDARNGIIGAGNVVSDSLQSFASLIASRSPGARGDASTLLKVKKGQQRVQAIPRTLPKPDEIAQVPEDVAPLIVDEPPVPQTFAAADIPPVPGTTTQIVPPPPPPVPLVPNNQPPPPNQPPPENPPPENPPPAIPEPSTWAMMLLGFAVVGSTLKRRRRVEFPLEAAQKA